MSQTSEPVSIVKGNAFVVSDASGDVEVSPAVPTGFFIYDTRFLSTWILTINDQRLHNLSNDQVHYNLVRFFVVPGEATVYVEAALSVVRQRTVHGGIEEELTVFNYGHEPASLTVRLRAGCDFADIFDIKNAQTNGKKGSLYSNVNDDSLVLGYTRETFRRETLITASEPARFDEQGLTFTIDIEPHSQWTTQIKVAPAIIMPDGENVIHKWRQGYRGMPRDLDEMLSVAPRLTSGWDPLKHIYHRSIVDLAALRYSSESGHGAMPAAGLPWFMSIFGRDSILTGLQALPFIPELAATTLRVLADWQGARSNDRRDEDPGRMPHEIRVGESMAFSEQPHQPYYGTADATPLFVVLMDEYERWTGDADLVRELEFEARAALNWIDEYADLTGNGYISYQRRTEQGLENQCWKDSWDSLSYHDGRLPGFPRATCECQGYAYDAKMRGARLARQFWNDPAYGDRLEREAGELKEKFNSDFWIADRQFFALALDGDGAQVDAISSNMGHLLWSGIADESKAEAVVAHLMGPKLYSGWGIRTLGEDEARYNPIGYHTGTVWPFDNSFIAWGMRRYGYHQEAAQVAAGILDAAQFFDGRLPEAFGGYERKVTSLPVRYPTACSPQAWSSGAPLLFLRTMLGLEPIGDNLIVNPALPSGMARIGLLDIPGRWGRVDAFGRERVVDSNEALHPPLGEMSREMSRTDRRPTDNMP
ncbi:amylo-alpha-1,6-glucosidase [Rugosimonospora acidiphila]|uniref:Amylo-alpha-1,6-glucosidase n=1 Tax=Rugosimonospora acidiphila TaxID=556531 RepID=A0ABP9SFM9_9ACTN